MSKSQILSIVKSCKSIEDLDLSFLNEVDDEILSQVGLLCKTTLKILQIRLCKSITSEGVREFWENISGYSKIKEQLITDGKETKRLSFNFPTESILERLNLADNKQLKNEICKPIANFLFPELWELSIWGNHYIDDKGFLDLWITRSDKFRRVNYCGCYKISDDSRLWLSNQFQRMIIYNKVDDFGAAYF